MSAKSLKIFGLPTIKWRPCKCFAILKENHLLMINIFKLHEYQTFDLMKIHNMCKILFANKIFSLQKVWFTISGPSKKVFFNFCFLPSPKFQMTSVKNFYNGFCGFLVISTTSQIFLIYTFVTMKRQHF